jgi:hypothetical protein
MKLLPHLAVAIAIAIAGMGCKSAADYQRNNSATAAWLPANAGRPGINVAGDWDSPDWGEAHFKQAGSRVTGILGDYPIGGVINGDKLYLAITSNGWTDYTAVLSSQFGGSLAGSYCGSVPFVSEDGDPIELKRAHP